MLAKDIYLGLIALSQECTGPVASQDAGKKGKNMKDDTRVEVAGSSKKTEIVVDDIEPVCPVPEVIQCQHAY